VRAQCSSGAKLRRAPTFAHNNEAAMSKPDSKIVRRPDAYVVAGALFDAQGRLLLAERPPGKHMAGGWEFPGGKRELNEERLDTLKRELQEELGIAIHEAEPLVSYAHEYADRTITLDLWFVTRYEGVPQSLEGQNLRWVKLDELDSVGLLEADAPMVAPLLERARR
jgi:8-oxo-dGTP diphosphatase